MMNTEPEYPTKNAWQPPTNQMDALTGTGDVREDFLVSTREILSRQSLIDQLPVLHGIRMER
jgi:hypothetical protein